MSNNDSLSNFFNEANIISVYTRAQALADGFLIDVSHMPKEAGFTVPVAVTNAVWERCIFWTDEDTERQTIQHTNGRLWDVLSMLRLAIACTKVKAVSLCCKLSIIPPDGRSRKPKATILKSVMSGGDKGEPVITIMLPEED